MPNQRVEFQNEDGHTLSGILDTPATAARAYALFAHCFTCSKNLKAANHISHSLTEAGIAVLRFDFTGLGQSEGEFADTNFSSNVRDLIAACRYLEEHHEGPKILLGHSLGGTAVLQAAPAIPSSVAVATIGSPADPTHVAHMFSGHEETLAEHGEAEVQLGGRPFRMKQQFLDDLERHDLPTAIASLRKALLVMHSPLDDIVEIDNASRLFAAAKHPKSFVSLDKADHLLTGEAEARYAGQVLAAWAGHFLPEREAPQQPLVAGKFETVARTRSGGFLTDVQVADHALTADEPSDFGGTDLGPSPYGLLSAALASCTTMTLQMYARHKKIELRSATVRVRHRKIHAEDCADCESEGGRIDEFNRVLELDGEMTNDQRQRMLEIADRCPVHRTLHSEVKVRTELADG